MAETEQTRGEGTIAEQPGVSLHGRIAVLDRARALWRGDAFDEVADEEWARVESARRLGLT